MAWDESAKQSNFELLAPGWANQRTHENDDSSRQQTRREPTKALLARRGRACLLLTASTSIACIRHRQPRQKQASQPIDRWIPRHLSIDASTGYMDRLAIHRVDFWWAYPTTSAAAVDPERRALDEMRHVIPMLLPLQTKPKRVDLDVEPRSFLFTQPSHPDRKDREAGNEQQRLLRSSSASSANARRCIHCLGQSTQQSRGRAIETTNQSPR